MKISSVDTILRICYSLGFLVWLCCFPTLILRICYSLGFLVWLFCFPTLILSLKDVSCYIVVCLLFMTKLTFGANICAWKADGLWRHEFAIYEYKLTIHSILNVFFVTSLTAHYSCADISWKSGHDSADKRHQPRQWGDISFIARRKGPGRYRARLFVLLQSIHNRHHCIFI